MDWMPVTVSKAAPSTAKARSPMFNPERRWRSSGIGILQRASSTSIFFRDQGSPGWGGLAENAAL